MKNPHNQAPKTKNGALKGLAAGATVLALTAGAYLEGRHLQSRSDRDDVAAARVQGRKEISDKLLNHPRPLEHLKWLEGQTGESIKKLKGEKLFDNAARVQMSILSISSDLKISGQEVFERLVPKNAQEAYEQSNMHFIFVETNPDDPNYDYNCLNPFGKGSKGNPWAVGFFPLDASPDNPSPDIDPRDAWS